MGFLWEVLIASALWLFLKTTILLYIFSHQFINLSELIYHWTRDFRLGEITFAGGNFWRVFLQSQNFVLFIAVALCAGLFFVKKTTKIKELFLYLLILLCLFSTLIMSYSRSFWLALFVSLFVIIIFSGVNLGFKTMMTRLFILSGTVILSLLLVYFTVNFPYPRISTSGGLITKRLQNISGEAGGSSRLNQLQPLWEGIIRSPLLGSGFGTPITYISNDPRVVASSVDQSGIYTTYSFEWGYLDVWLKIGLLGLGVYLWFIYMLILKAYKNKQLLSQALVFGFIAIAITHVTTPYLNHPLGIGLLFILLASCELNYETI
ncbi:MAG: O-antigen ligase family protein, partial [Candidatus Margulisiibacteriota bacterium]|jgi:O-antigen ligase